MKARLWLNIGLLLLVLLLALLAYYQPGLAPEGPVKLTSLSAQQVTRLRVEQAGQAPLLLEKQAGKWNITEPVRVEANTLRVETVLRLAEADSLARFPARDPALDLAKFKLDAPQLRVWLNDVSIAFGDSAPLGQQRYLLLGDTVHLIAGDVYYYLSGGLPLFAADTLLPQDAQLQSLTLPGFSLSRVDGRWRLDPSREVSMDDIVQFLDAWRGAQALQVTRYQGQPAQGRVTAVLVAPGFLDRCSRRDSTSSIPGVVPPATLVEPFAGALPCTAQDGHSSIRTLEFSILAREPELILARPDLGLQYHLGSGAGQRLLQLPQAAERSAGISAGTSTSTSAGAGAGR